MTRYAINLAILVLTVLVAPLSVAQEQMPRIGVVGKLDRLAHDALRQGLAELGYVEGRNVAIELREEWGRAGQFDAIAAELVATKVEVIFALGPAALQGAAKATAEVPIVAIDLETDPVASGFAASWARPGKNITGLFLDAPELMGKWLELLKEIHPGLSRVSVLWDPATGRYQLMGAKAAAQRLGVQLQTLEARGASDFDRAIASARRWRPDALIQLSSPVMFHGAKQLADLTLKARLPAISLFSVFPKAGGFMSYGVNAPDMVRRCGVYVGRVLKGTKPQDLPIERPAKFEVVINARTAKALGIMIPESILVRVDEVIR